MHMAHEDPDSPAVDDDLLPGEAPDVKVEAEKFFADADEWLAAPNDRLGGLSPNNWIEMGREDVVRDLLRSIKYIAFS